MEKEDRWGRKESEECEETGAGRKGGKVAEQGGEQTGKAECRKAQKQGKDDWRKKRQCR